MIAVTSFDKRLQINCNCKRFSMFDFVRKPFLWDAWDSGLDVELKQRGCLKLKTIQDLAVYDLLRSKSGLKIAEIGGGKSRILGVLAKKNACWNIEKFEGANGGPSSEIIIDGVENIHAFLGERSSELKGRQFDVVFSISVVEHVPLKKLGDFLEEGLELLKPGGLWIHAIDFYLEDEPSEIRRERYEANKLLYNHPALKPIGPIYDGPLGFTCDMATNPDDTMYKWGKGAPKLTDLRKQAQSVSILLACEKL